MRYGRSHSNAEIARALELSMAAKKGAPNQAPKSPPWDGFWVGDNYYLELGELR